MNFELYYKLLQEKVNLLHSKLTSNPDYQEYIEYKQELENLSKQLDFPTVNKITKYDPKMSLIEKGKFALTIQNKEMTTGQIADVILKYQPAINRKHLVSGLSSVLGTHAANGKFVNRFKNNAGEWVYSIIK